MINRNKKGFVGDTIIASAALIVVVLVISVVALILFNFNSEIQSSSVGSQAKAAADEANTTFPPILGYAFVTIFMGFFIYTIVTAAIIDKIHPIFWVLGFVIVLISTIITSILKAIYGQVETVDLLAAYIAAIPGAGWYFPGMEIYNVIWMGIQLTIVYFKKDT